MRRIINVLLVAVCLGMAMPAQAQLIKFGVKGGLNLAKADFNKSDLKTDNFTGFFIGPMAEVTIPVVGLGVDGSLLFSQRGIKVGDESIKENGLDIPINLKYTIGLGSMLGVYVAAGPDFYFNFSGDKKYDNLGDFNRKNAQIGINVGAGVKLLKHLQVGFNYNIPLNNSGDYSISHMTLTEPSSTSTIKNSYKMKMWQISAAYIF
ncbi:porin family protein [Bacteroides sp.]